MSKHNAEVFTLPSWFKLEIGFKFIDESGEVAIYLGKTSKASYDIVGSFKGDPLFTCQHEKITHAYMYYYKGEWNMGALEELESETINEFQPVELNNIAYYKSGLGILNAI